MSTANSHSASSGRSGPPNILLIGTGEYTTGLVNGQPSNSDKAAGIIALTVFHLRSRGLTGPRIALCGTNGRKLPSIRQHMQRHIGDRYGLDVQCETYPADSVERDPQAYTAALQRFERGDVAIVTTPDQTHFAIAAAAIERGLHVLVAKPVVQTLADHQALVSQSELQAVLVGGELHKRWDPFYADASDRISSGSLGSLVYYYAYMSQPKSQLSTFSGWINDKSTDISYYLNSHHVDFLCNALTANSLRAKPSSVFAAASHGLANAFLAQHHPSSEAYDVDDSITLTVSFVDQHQHVGTAVFTSCWTAPLRPDAHTQQTQHFVGHKGEIHIDQAHRGYSSTTDAVGVASHNPLFFKYTQDRDGRFAGSGCYGYLSFEHFIRAATRVNEGEPLAVARRSIVSVDSDASMFTTAILEAGKKSLQEKRPVQIQHGQDGSISFQ